MYLSQLDIHQVRNLGDISFQPGKQCNYIYGSNASGKTSILEAIYLLSLSRSFRTTHIKQVITHSKKSLYVFAHLSSNETNTISKVGIEKSYNKSRIRINGSEIKNIAELSSLLPVQVINPDIHKLLEQGPKIRRQFIDWGVFHVEHKFLLAWQTYYRVLKQRNAALRAKSAKKSIILWDNQLITSAKNLTLSRELYLAKFLPYFNNYIRKLMGIDVEIGYFRGWNKDLSFTETLNKNFDKDLFKGFTAYGPHRADLTLLYNNIAVQDVFSRGQQKLLVCAMRLAQISHLENEIGQKCIILVDDLAAELDLNHRQKLIDLLIETKAQLFLTATDKDSFSLPTEINVKMFHVEHGRLKEVVQ